MLIKTIPSFKSPFQGNNHVPTKKTDLAKGQGRYFNIQAENTTNLS
jgi:hypothetical protein